MYQTLQSKLGSRILFGNTGACYIRPLTLLRRPIVSVVSTRGIYNHQLTETRSKTNLIGTLRGLSQKRCNTTRFELSVGPSRTFHCSSPRRNSPFFGNGRPPFKVYRFSPIVAFFAGIAALMLFVTILPFVFTFFFPLIIAGICVYQFRKWRSKVLFQEILKSLKKSSMHVRYSTVNALHLKGLDRMVRIEQKNAMVFEDLLKSFDAELKANLDEASSADAERLIKYVEDRLLEAIETNEEGIRSYFLGDDVASWVRNNYDLQLDKNQYKTSARIMGNELVMMLTFPWYLKSSEYPKKHLANVSLAVLQSQFKNDPGFNYLAFLSRASKSDVECKMVISVQPISTILPRQFILSTNGKSGDWHAKYDVRTTPGGHTEYTIKSRESDV